jgi:hypothetical protein
MYLFRWQLSTPILAPLVAFGTGTATFSVKAWEWSAIANLIGGLVFFWVDKFIFTSSKIDPIWQVIDMTVCEDCHHLGRGYRLVQSGNYNKAHSYPEFRCEKCSIEKYNQLRAEGKLK